MHHDADDEIKTTRDTGENDVSTDKNLASVTNREAMTLIPWEDIWASLKMAKHRGDGEMIEVFYDTLFKEAVFDDNGAWAWNINKRE